MTEKFICGTHGAYIYDLKQYLHFENEKQLGKLLNHAPSKTFCADALALYERREQALSNLGASCQYDD